MGTRHGRPRPERLAEKLAQIRRAAGYTLEEMAAALSGVKQSPPLKSHVLRFETGEREPTLLYLLEVSKVFAVSLRDLIDDEREIKPPKRVRKR